MRNVRKINKLKKVQDKRFFYRVRVVVSANQSDGGTNKWILSTQQFQDQKTAPYIYQKLIINTTIAQD